MGAAAIIERAIKLAKEDLEEGPKKSLFGAWLMAGTAMGLLKDGDFSSGITLSDRAKYQGQLYEVVQKIKPSKP